MKRVGRMARLVSWTIVALTLGFVFVPLVIVVLFSFNSTPRMSFPLDGFSFRWYVEAFTDPLVLESLGRSAVAAGITGLIAGTVGLLAALALARVSPRSRAVLITLAALPLAFPALLYAIGLAISYRELGVGLSLAATIAGHVIIAFPFVVLVLSAAIARFRRPLLEAASDLGASPWTAFRTVALPLLFPAVVGATLLAMALSLDEFVIAFFTAGQDKTLPLVLYARLNQGLNPSLNAMGTVLFAVTTTLALFAARRMSRDV